MANTILSNELETLIDAFANKPREILQLPQTSIQENQVAELTIFDPQENFVFTSDNNLSLSHNSPLFNITLKGKVIGIVNKEKTFFNKNTQKTSNLA